MAGILPLKPIDDLESFWNTLHATLSVDYTLPAELIDRDGAGGDPEERNPASCSDIAKEIIKNLVQNGHKPSALFIADRGVINHLPQTPRLLPKTLPGVEWTCHIVCEDEGLIYDPVFSQPLPTEEYLRQMFDQEVLVNPLTEL